MMSKMDSDEDKRLPCDQENNKSDGFDQELSEEVEKMIKKTSCCMKISEGKAKKIDKANELASESAESGMRVCDFCGKKFSSGKALGGHRRYHLQALKKTGQSPNNNKLKIVHSQSHNNNLPNNISKKPTLEEEKQQLDDDDDVKLVNGKLLLGHSRCCLCKKYFPSKKSLFGHMRSHPEREWRGVKPPFVRNGVNIEPPLDQKVEEEFEDLNFNNNNNNNNNGSSSSSSVSASASLEEVAAEAVDLLVSCSLSWSKKDKRGRQSIGAIEAAETLVILSRRGNNRPFLPSPCPPPQDATPLLIPLKKRKKNIVNNVKKDNAEIDDEKIWKLKAMTRKKEKKKLKEKKCEEVLARKEELMITGCYECKICRKSFSTFQALGGHRSRHNKDKNVVNVVSTKKEEEEEDDEGEDEAAHKVCVNETFSSTSGLGGNDDYSNMIMRSLSTGLSQEDEEGASLNSEDRLLLSYDNNNNNNDNNVHEEEEELEEASQSGSKMLDFDLNEPYVTEDGPSDKSLSFQ